MNVAHNDILFIMGNSINSFVFGNSGQIIKLNISLYSLEKDLKDDFFILINDYTIINTKYILTKHKNRQITIKGGSVHKVSRKLWKHFIIDAPFQQEWR